MASTEIHASKLGDFFRSVFPGLSSRPQTDPAGNIGRPSSSEQQEQRHQDSFQNYQPNDPPTLEELGHGEQISDGLPRTSVTIDRFGVCRVVSNSRGDLLTVAIPHLIEAEWASFVQHPPEGITLAACGGPAVVVAAAPAPTGSCDAGFNDDDIYAVIGNVRSIFTSQPPLVGVAPHANARAATINYICDRMGCGPPRWIATRTYSSPENNAIVRWTGSQWEKTLASVDNYRLSGCGGNQPMIRCLPLGSPAGSVQRINCD